MWHVTCEGQQIGAYPELQQAKNAGVSWWSERTHVQFKGQYIWMIDQWVFIPEVVTMDAIGWLKFPQCEIRGIA